MELVFIQKVALKRWADFSIFYCLVSCPEIGTHVRFKLTFAWFRIIRDEKVFPESNRAGLEFGATIPQTSLPSLVGIQHSHLLPNCNIWTEFCLCKNIQKVLVFIPVWNWNQTLKPQNCCKMELSSSQLKGLLCVSAACKITRSQSWVWAHILWLCVSGCF